MQLENHNIFLAQLKAKSIKLVNIGAEDLWSGDRKLVLGLTWTLILRYELHQFGGNETELLDWSKTLGTKYGLDLQGGWTQAFGDGKAFAAMVHEAEPEVLDLEKTKNMNQQERLQTAFDAGASRTSARAYLALAAASFVPHLLPCPRQAISLPRLLLLLVVFCLCLQRRNTLGCPSSLSHPIRRLKTASP